ncbi:MAG: diacylglycerol kinase family protein [Bacteroidales bacterium]
MNRPFDQYKKKVLFIINPVSGVKDKKYIEKIIENKIDHNKFSWEIKYSQERFHATRLAEEAVKAGFNIIVAVGGDGTVNEVSKSLVNTNVFFGIIPVGSGNGLARSLNIPLNISKAIKTINNSRFMKIDTIKINDDSFVNMAGVGFDAYIGHLFANYGKRGFKSYVKLILKEAFKYKSDTYQLIADDKTIETKAFLISFANSTQFGNNAHIAPLAEINDGLIDICILEKIVWWQSLFLILLMYTKKISYSKYYKLVKAKQIEISFPENLVMHLDGDPVRFNSIVRMEIVPESLNVIVP